VLDYSCTLLEHPCRIADQELPISNSARAHLSVDVDCHRSGEVNFASANLHSVEVIAANCYFVAHLAFDAHLILPTTAVAAIRVSTRASVLAIACFGATPLFKERRGDGSFWIRSSVWRRLRDRHSDGFEYQKGGEDKRKALEMHCEDFCGDKW